MSLTRLTSLLLLLAAALPAQGLLVRGGGGGVSCPSSTHKYLINEGSGGTTNDSVGSLHFTLNGASWVTGGLEFPSTAYASATGLSYDLVANDFSACMVIKPVSYGSRLGLWADFNSGHGVAITISINASCLAEMVYQGGGSGQRDNVRFGPDNGSTACSTSLSAETVYELCVAKPAGRDASAITASVNGTPVIVEVVTDAFDGSETISYSGNQQRLGASQQSGFGSSTNGEDVLWSSLFLGDLLTADEQAACCNEAKTDMAAQGVTVTCP